MLCPVVMNLQRFPLPLLLLVVPTGAHCDPADEGPPPATAANEQSASEEAMVGSPPPASAAPSEPPPSEAPSEAPPSEAPPSEAPPGAPGAANEPGVTPGAAAAEGPGSSTGEYAVGDDTDSYEDDDPAALTDFRPALDPYGGWVDDPTYGTVWVPSQDTVGADFRPYVSSGHWTYDNDWVWVSDYPWGWAPFHYGRWVLVEGRGWSWIPGRAYRGAWVDWSVDDGYGYLGWAPTPPLFLWFGGTPVGWQRGYLPRRWAYCPRAAVFAPAVATRVVAGPAAAALTGRMHIYVSAAARASRAALPPSALATPRRRSRTRRPKRNRNSSARSSSPVRRPRSLWAQGRPRCPRA